MKKKKKNPSLIGNSKVKSLILGQSWKSEHTVAGGVLLQKMPEFHARVYR